MTTFLRFGRPSRSGGVRRAWCVGLAAGGALLLPASEALATHMVDANGMPCPHASGEGPNALPPADPSSSAPGRVSSEAPLGAPRRSAASGGGSTPASRPAARATNPAQVTQPVTQVQTQRPATTTPQAAPGTSASRTVDAVARAAVPVRARSTQPRARRSAPTGGPARRAIRAPQPVGRTRVNGLEPRTAPPSTASAGPAVVVRDEASSSALPAMWVGLGLILLAGLAAGLVAMRRRDGGGVVLTDAPERPATPSYAEALVEAELHEMISEARARDLLSDDQADAPVDGSQSVAPR